MTFFCNGAMIERIEGIVTDIVKHNDSHNVVTLYTRSRGRMAFLVPVGKSRTGRMRNALLSYMAVVQADVNIRAGKELHTLRKAEPLRLWHGIYSDPVKSSILFFLTEFCSRLLRQYPADGKLWDYLTGSLEVLDRAESARVANFHLAFLIRLLPLAGIEPHSGEGGDGMQFDMNSGEMFDTKHPGATVNRRMLLGEGESRAIGRLLRMNFRNMHLYRLSGEQRARILERLTAYYSIHLPIGADFKTLPVLHELFL